MCSECLHSGCTTHSRCLHNLLWSLNFPSSQLSKRTSFTFERKAACSITRSATSSLLSLLWSASRSKDLLAFSDMFSSTIRQERNPEYIRIGEVPMRGEMCPRKPACHTNKNINNIPKSPPNNPHAKRFKMFDKVHSILVYDSKQKEGAWDGRQTNMISILYVFYTLTL